MMSAEGTYSSNFQNIRRVRVSDPRQHDEALKGEMLQFPNYQERNGTMATGDYEGTKALHCLSSLEILRKKAVSDSYGLSETGIRRSSIPLDPAWPSLCARRQEDTTQKQSCNSESFAACSQLQGHSSCEQGSRSEAAAICTC